jgi:hypothetical protein
MAVSRTDADRRKYLARALQLNPLRQAEDLLRLRRRFHGLETADAPGEAGSEQLRARRETVTAQFEELREKFWTLTPAELEAAFQQISAARFPDLEQGVQRLRVLAEYRPGLALLAQHKHFDGELFSHMKRILVLPQRQAEAIREKALRELDTRAKIRKAKRMIALLRKRSPEIHRLEAAWFERLAKAKPTATSGGEIDYTYGGVGAAGVIIAIIVMRLLFTVLRHQGS